MVKGSIQDGVSITIENTEPIIGDIEIIPNTPISQDDLVCTPSNIQDINQDVVTFSYTWFVNDVEQAENHRHSEFLLFRSMMSFVVKHYPMMVLMMVPLSRQLQLSSTHFQP